MKPSRKLAKQDGTISFNILILFNEEEEEKRNVIHFENASTNDGPGARTPILIPPLVLTFD